MCLFIMVFSVFRELLQNSDDAASKSVEVHFESQAYIDRRRATENTDGGINQTSDNPPDLKTQAVCHMNALFCLILKKMHQVAQWTFKNNGIIFREEDWSRLKKIGFVY